MKNKKDKQDIVRQLRERFEKAKGYILINLSNLKGNSQFLLKEILKSQNSLFQVAKKTLIYRANPHFPFKDEETKIPFGLIWEFDENLNSFRALKTIKEKGLEINIVSGYFEGRVLKAEDVVRFSELPSKDQLISNLAYSLKSLNYRLNFTLAFPLKKLISTLSLIKK